MLSLGRGALLVALCAIAGAGCSESGSGSQVITGRVNTSGALAVRAVTSDNAVLLASVRSDGTFSLALPAHQTYRLEVLTTSGVRHVLKHSGGSFGALSFQVCEPVDPWDVGGIGDGTMPGGGGGYDNQCPDPMDLSDPDCKVCPAGDPNCAPPPCDPATGMDCGGCDPGDPNCAPPCTGDPTDPNCMPPPPCNAGDPNCMPPPCADPGEPNCSPCDPTTGVGCCAPGDPSCGTMCTDPMDPNCMPPPPDCDDPTDPYCKCNAAGECPPPVCGANDPMCPPPPPPPCADPNDPMSCKDPCVLDPATCGCAMGEPNCWPDPQPPECNAAGMCDPGTGGMTPDHPPGDFGCKDVMLP